MIELGAFGLQAPTEFDGAYLMIAKIFILKLDKIIFLFGYVAYSKYNFDNNFFIGIGLNNTQYARLVEGWSYRMSSSPLKLFLIINFLFFLSRRRT